MNMRTLTLVVLTILLSACTQTVSPASPIQPSNTPPAAQTPTITATVTLTAAPSATRTYAPTRTRIPTKTRTPTPTPTPTSPYPQLILSTEIPPLGDSGMADLHNMIIFQSKDWLPFPSLHVNDGGSEYTLGAMSQVCPGPYAYPSINCLWAISPDGQSGRMLSSSDFDMDFILALNGSPIVVENGFTINHPSIQPVRLPEMCSQDPNSSYEQRCDHVRLSPNGRFLAFLYGENPCAKRAMQVIDRQTGAVVLEYKGGVDRIGFLPNGKMMIWIGHCGGMGLEFFDPATRQTVDGGGVMGLNVWNLSGTTLVATNNEFYGNASELWGYYGKTGTAFWPEKERSLNQNILFLPDDKRFLYQHLPNEIDNTTSDNIIDTPAVIVRYDPASRQRVVLASDPAYHYRLCQFDSPEPCPLQWYGDWIQVQRVPFEPYRSNSFEWNISSELPCYIMGQNCPTPPEPFALNTETGELVPWDPAALPQVSPTPTPGPDLQAQPIYTDPAGLYALYTSTDGASLWMVPKEGPPVQWAIGENFFYLP